MAATMGEALKSHAVAGVGAPAFPAYRASSSEIPVSLRKSAEGKNSVTNRDKSAGKFSGLNAGNFPVNPPNKARAFRLTQSEWRAMSSDAWRQFAGDRSGAAKFIAEIVECSPKTAQSWLDGESTPAGILDMRAMNSNPIYAALKREIAGMASDMDPRLQAKYQELHRLTLELAGAP